MPIAFSDHDAVILEIRDVNLPKIGRGVWKNNTLVYQQVKISVVDFACPLDNGADALELAATRKVDKYRELCENLARSSGKRVSFHTYIIGSLGRKLLLNTRSYFY